MPLIFICYARVDQSVALTIYERLTAAGLRAWIDQRSIRPGVSYAEAIGRALEEATAVVLLVTAASNQSREVHKEIQLASNRHLPILPLWLEDVSYHPTLAYHISGAQWIDGITDEPQAIETLVSQLNGVQQSAPLPRSGGRVARRTRHFMRTIKKVAIITASVALVVVGALIVAYILLWNAYENEICPRLKGSPIIAKQLGQPISCRLTRLDSNNTHHEYALSGPTGSGTAYVNSTTGNDGLEDIHGILLKVGSEEFLIEGQRPPVR